MIFKLIIHHEIRQSYIIHLINQYLILSMNFISYEDESEIPDELKCIFCDKIDKNQKQFNDYSFMYCPTCYDQNFSRDEFVNSFVINFMQIKCKYCKKFKPKIDLEWHQQKCIQFLQSNFMSFYETSNTNGKTILICLNQFCNQKIQFNNAYVHQLKCQWRIIDCPNKQQCQWTGPKIFFKLHSLKCMKQELKIEKQILFKENSN
ncbi:hypothetical protein pb186bvf_019825 [Paramecium bursaria]